MILTLAYCRRDIHQAERLMIWIGFLSAQNGLSMKKESLLLIPSRHASQFRLHSKIVRLAEKVFGRVIVHTPSSEDERPWPFSPNFMFRQALEKAELLQEDIFWMEPDAIPLVPSWFDLYKNEWDNASLAGKSFLGAFINDNPHMSGIGIYGRDWRRYAPKLSECRDIPWDLYARDEVNVHAHFVPLSHHIWNSPAIGETFLETVLQPRAVIFHQDKKGDLIRLLDRKMYGSVLSKILEDRATIMEPRYYHAENCSRAQESNGYTFRFEPYNQFAGVWRGVYVATDEGEQIALNALAAYGPSGVTELTEAEYEERAKKKAENSNGYAQSNPQPSSPVRAQIKQDHPAALVVNDPVPQPPPVPERGVIEETDLDRLLTVGPVEVERPPVEPQNKTKRNRKT